MSEHDRNGIAAGDPRDPDLDRRYRETAGEAPPPHLDAAILAAARREVGSRPQRPGAFAMSRWRLPVAVAAVVVLSVSLVTLMREQGGEELSAPPPPRARAPATAESADSAAPAPFPRAAPGQEAASRLKEETALARPAEKAAGGRAAQAPVQPPERQLQRAQSGQAAVEAEQRADRKAAVQSAAEPAAQSAPVAPAAAPSAAPRSERPALAERDAASALSAKPFRATPEAPSVGGVAGMRRESLADEARPSLTPAVAAEVKALETELAPKWLERIAALRRDGRGAEADELLAEFRRRFPDHPRAPGKNE